MSIQIIPTYAALDAGNLEGASKNALFPRLRRQLRARILRYHLYTVVVRAVLPRTHEKMTIVRGAPVIEIDVLVEGPRRVARSPLANQSDSCREWRALRHVSGYMARTHALCACRRYSIADVANSRILSAVS